MDENDIASQLREIAERLDFIERHLGIAALQPQHVEQPAQSEVEPLLEAVPLPHAPTPAAPPPVTPAATPAIVPPVAPPKPELQPRPVAPPQVVVTFTERHEPAPPPPPLLAHADVFDPARTPPRPRRSGTPLEILIGERWMAWVGAVIVVLAIGFFVKLAYDQSWFGRLTATARCLLAAGFGVALLVAGEVALRKVGRIAAVGLFGAGLGTLYLTAFATFRYFNLVSEVGAFWLLALVAAVGIVITVHGRLLTMGILSLIGGYLSPVLLQRASAFPAALPLYATVLLAIALVLSAVRADPFRPLRYVGLGAHLFIASMWVQSNGAQHWLLSLAFMAVSCYLVMGEALLATKRGQSGLGSAVATLIATAWFVTLGCHVLHDVRPFERNWLGLFTTAVACVATAAAFIFGPGLAALRNAPRTAMDKLALALWAEVGVLLAVAIALQYDGYGQTIGWLVLGLASIELGRRLISNGVSVFGLIVGALAGVRIVAFDYGAAALQGVVWSIDGLTLTHWGVLALIVLLGTHLAARRWRWEAQVQAHAVPFLLALAATIGWLGWCLVQGTGLLRSGLWLAGGIALLLLRNVGQRQRYFFLGLLAVFATAVRLVVVDYNTSAPEAVWWAFSGVTVTLWGLLALATILTLHLSARCGPPALSAEDKSAPASLCVIATLGWLGLCMTQCTGLAITALWLVGSVLLLALQRFGRRQCYLEIAGFTLVATAGHWLIADTILKRLASDWDAAAVTPFFNWQTGLAVAIAATGWWAFRVLLARARETKQQAATEAGHVESQGWQGAVLAAVLFLLIAFSFQTDVAVTHLYAAAHTFGHAARHLEHLLLTLLWVFGGFGVGLLAAATGRRDERGVLTGVFWLMRFAWLVVLICGGKWIVYDSLVLTWEFGFRTAAGVWPLLNIQMLVGVMVAVVAVILLHVSGVPRLGTQAGESNVSIAWERWIPVAASVLVLWGLSFEVDRLLCRLEARGDLAWLTLWNPVQLRMLWLTLLWALGGLAMMVYGRLRPWRPMFTAGWCGLNMLAAAWLILDTLFWRIDRGVTLVTPVANVQFIVGALLVVLLASAIAVTRRPRTDAPSPDPFATYGMLSATTLIICLGLWLGSLELDRFFAPEAARVEDPAMARQTALSVYWGVYAIILVALGFWKRAAPVRYGGLALLAITLGKVMVVDLAKVQYAYRVLSLLATGLLFIVTSIAYAKLASRLRAR